MTLLGKGHSSPGICLLLFFSVISFVVCDDDEVCVAGQWCDSAVSISNCFGIDVTWVSCTRERERYI